MSKSVRKELAKRAAEAAKRTEERIAQVKIAIEQVDKANDEVERNTREYVQLLQKVGGVAGHDAIVLRFENDEISPDDPEWKVMDEIGALAEKIAFIQTDFMEVENNLIKAQQAASEAYEEEKAAVEKLDNYKS